MKGGMKPADIIKKGSVEVHAKVSGIRQLHTLTVSMEETAWGTVPYLVCKHRIPAVELLRLAEELQLPIKCFGITAFPKGKAAQDFVIEEEEGGNEEEKEDEEEAKEKREAKEKKDESAEKKKEAKKDDTKDRKPRKRSLAHGEIMKESGGAEGGGEEKREDAKRKGEQNDEAGDDATPQERDSASDEKTSATATPEEKEPEPAESSQENQGASEEARTGEPAGAALPAPTLPGQEAETIEIESSSQPAAKETASGDKAMPSKEKKKFFPDSVLSEGLLR